MLTFGLVRHLPLVWFGKTSAESWFGNICAVIWFGKTFAEIWFGKTSAEIWFGRTSAQTWYGKISAEMWFIKTSFGMAYWEEIPPGSISRVECSTGNCQLAGGGNDSCSHYRYGNTQI